MTQSVKTRIPPSPTGFFHIGNARTALFNYLYARKYNGVFVVRIEDTDKERSDEAYTKDIHQQLEWLGITADETYVQSEHLSRHQELLAQLVESGKAYISKEPAKDDPTIEREVVRLKNSGKVVRFDDHVRGTVEFDTTDLGDFVIARSMNDPLYHFAVVVDDHDEGITHVIRGEDHISNTPRQILIQEALDFPRPEYAHLPLILAPDRTKLSKRKHSTAVKDFREQGYVPEALVNFLAKLGWSDGTDKELFSMEELIAAFNFEQIHKSGAIWDEEKLKWLNREYIRAMGHDDFAQYIQEWLPTVDDTTREKLLPLLRERISTGAEAQTLYEAGEFDFALKTPVLDVASLSWKDTSLERAGTHLSALQEKLSELDEKDFANPSVLKDMIWPYAEEKGRGEVLWPLRYALSGREKSPDPFTMMSIIGKKETRARLEAAQKLVQ